MLNKKGMSPLLLTIILIAFAVALGAMVMSWGSTVVNAPQTSCEKVELKFQQAFGKDLICFNETTGKLIVVIKNTGQGTINSVLYRKINLDLTNRDIILPLSTIKQGELHTAEIPHQQSDKIHIELIPQIKNEEVETLCTNKALIVETIPSCG